MKSFLHISALLMLAACSPQIRVYSDADPDYDLQTYHTFDWGQKVNIEQGNNPLLYNELNDKRIKSAVAAQMALHGYTLTSENPDLILHYHIIINDQSIITPEPYGYRYGPYWMHLQTNTYSYREGTLILDLMDKNAGELIWRGWAVTAIDQVDPEQIDNLIKTAVARIFKKYPKGNVKTRKPAKEIVSN
jgi:Domain of unknown function (DUF4136)